jgi:pyridoxine kinase
VLGDYGADGVGKLYVPESLVSIYRDEIIPLADIVTPNQFEVELITEKKITSESEAWEGLKWFHDKGVKIVALSSSNIGKENELVAFLSAMKEGGKVEKFKLSIPKQGPIHLTGTGDLFAALFMAHSTKFADDLGKALELTIASVQSTIATTLDSMPESLRTGKVAVTAQQRELKIIQSKKHFENPEVKLKAIRVD